MLSPKRYALSAPIMEEARSGYYVEYREWTEINDQLTEARTENQILKDFIIKVCGRSQAEINDWTKSGWFKKIAARAKIKNGG